MRCLRYPICKRRVWVIGKRKQPDYGYDCFLICEVLFIGIPPFWFSFQLGVRRRCAPFGALKFPAGTTRRTQYMFVWSLVSGEKLQVTSTLTMEAVNAVLVTLWLCKLRRSSPKRCEVLLCGLAMIGLRAYANRLTTKVTTALLHHSHGAQSIPVGDRHHAVMCVDFY